MPPDSGACMSRVVHDPAPGGSGRIVATTRPTGVGPRLTSARSSPPSPTSLPATTMSTGSDTAARPLRWKPVMVRLVVALGMAEPCWR